MAKTKTPFLSMGAQGSVGGSITAQKKASETLLRGKPFPTDPYSLKQAYQRWLYEDYAYLWRQQTQATRRTYATAGSPFHLTGFQYWMKYNLTNMPDIAGIWHLDAEDHTICYDHSPRGNNGTVIGASPASGRIDGALYFDGINDVISIPHSASLSPTPTIRISCRFYPVAAPPSTRGFIDKRHTPTTTGYAIAIYATGDIRFFIYDGAGSGFTALVPIAMAAWSYIDAWYNGSEIFLYINGELKSSALINKTLLHSTTPLQFGKNEPSIVRFVNCYLDEIMISTRAPTALELSRFNDRRYPPQ